MSMPESQSLISKSWTSKPCDICGEPEQHTVLGNRTEIRPTRHGLYEFAHTDVICDKCGFVFAGRIPNDEFLENYYRDAYSLQSDIKVIKPDFDPEARLKIIRQFVSPGSSVWEIGAASGEFCDILNDYGYQAIGIDPLQKCSDNVEEKGLFESGSGIVSSVKFDCAASYFVLEHITRPRAWIKQIRRHLKPEGILITEVPNFIDYPEESLFPEHMLHFTPHHLQVLLEGMGFVMLMLSRDGASRPFGFTAVSMLKADTREDYREFYVPSQDADLQELIANENIAYENGIIIKKSKDEKYRSLGQHIGNTVENLQPKQVKIYFWPANDIAGNIASKLPEELGPDVIDSSSSKIGSQYPGFTKPVQPPALEKNDTHHRIFILCSPSWNSDIEQMIAEKGLEDITVIDGVAWNT